MTRPRHHVHRPALVAGPPQRTEMPDRLVNMREAMFMDMSSWNSSLAAYGMCTCAMRVLFLQGRHSNDCLVRLLSRSC